VPSRIISFLAYANNLSQAVHLILGMSDQLNAFSDVPASVQPSEPKQVLTKASLFVFHSI
jgi:hypothetical protein